MALICEYCGNQITHDKPIEKYGKYFCCVHCLGTWEVRTKRRKVDRSQLVPRVMKWVDTCLICAREHKNVRILCLSEGKRGSGAFRIKFSKHFTMPWCCHAQHNLSCMLTDGSVSINTAKQIITTAERITKELGHEGVTPADMGYAYAELLENFEYIKPEKVTIWIEVPEAKPVDHATACMVCDDVWRGQCIFQWDIPWEIYNELKNQTGIHWCPHALLSVAGILDSGRFKEENLKKLLHLAERVAAEKDYPAVTTRIIFIALGRAVQG